MAAAARIDARRPRHRRGASDAPQAYARRVRPYLRGGRARVRRPRPRARSGGVPESATSAGAARHGAPVIGSGRNERCPPNRSWGLHGLVRTLRWAGVALSVNVSLGAGGQLALIAHAIYAIFRR